MTHRTGVALVAVVSLAIGLVGAVRAGTAATTDPWSAFAAPVFRNYDQDSGLPDEATTTAVQDGIGYMWFGTEGGLARFDGYRFHSYKPVSSDPNALPDSWVTALLVDREERLWVGTSAGGLARYDRERDRFDVYAAGRRGLSHVHVTALADGDRARVWVGTENGLDLLDPTSRQVVVYRHAARDPASVPDDRILALLRDRAGTLWVGTRRGVAKLVRGATRFERVRIDARLPGELSVDCLYEDSVGRVWFGTIGHGAYVLGPRDAHARPVEERADRAHDFRREWISAIGAGERGGVWLGTYGHGIVAIDEPSGRTHRIEHAPGPEALADGTIWALARDRAGDLWVCTPDGVGRLESSGDAILSLRSGEGSGPRLSDDDVPSLYRAHDGRVWAGTNTKGIDIIDARRARLANVAPNRRTPGSALPSTYVLALEGLPSGEVYAGTAAGMYRIDRTGKRVERITLPGRESTARTYAIVRAGTRLWVGGADDGLWSFSPRSPSHDVEHYDVDKLTDRRIVSLLLGRSGELWIGTRNGLDRLDLATHKIERARHDPADPTALPGAYVAAMAYDRSGRLWVATSDGGIAILTGRRGGHLTFRRLDVAGGLPDENIDAMLPDARGRMWVTTDGGMAVIDEATFAVHAIGRADGAPASPYWVHSSTALPNGDLLFGSAGAGITIVRPDRFELWNERPPIVVTEARVGGRIVPSSRLSDRTPAPLVVPPETNGVLVEFAALDYSAPEKNRYAYRLDGLDTEWNVTDATRRVAAYTNLPPGDHVLHLRGTNRAGTWSVATTDVLVRVLPAWYQTWWYRLLATVAAALCVVVVVQGRTSYLRRRQLELERVVAERTTELEESKRRIEAIAHSDPLTGLPNRRQFNDDVRVATANAERHRRHCALLLIDLDFFKNVNDTLGHDAGDALLVDVARRLKSSLRRSDRIARLGGDEFAILLDDLPGAFATDREGIAWVCTRVLESFEAPIFFDGHSVRTTPSIGVALAPEHAEKPATLYKAADLALYRAKHEGRNTWRVYEPGVTATEPARPAHASA